MQNPNDSEDYWVCPNCGEDLPAGATFCRHCGASDDAGWDGDDSLTETDGLDEWDDDSEFDYDEFLSREFPDQAATRDWHPTSRSILLAAIALLCIALLLLGMAF
jgi:MoCo/4Fe-4S cofactor protein with predicted Tat translocation signal